MTAYGIGGFTSSLAFGGNGEENVFAGMTSAASYGLRSLELRSTTKYLLQAGVIALNYGARNRNHFRTQAFAGNTSPVVSSQTIGGASVGTAPQSEAFQAAAFRRLFKDESHGNGYFARLNRVTIGGSILPFTNASIIVYDRLAGFFPTSRAQVEISTTAAGAGITFSFDSRLQATSVPRGDEIGVQLGQSRYLSLGTNNALNSFDLNIGIGIAIPGIGFSKVIQKALQ